jgi:hypothetical protein
MKLPELLIIVIGLFSLFNNAEDIEHSSILTMMTWIKGSSETNQIEIYGSTEVESLDNTPGGRLGSVIWTDFDGNPYLFGGKGYGASSSLGFLNDLWYLNISSLCWKWLKGSSLINQIEARSSGAWRSGGKACWVGCCNTPRKHRLYGSTSSTSE